MITFDEAHDVDCRVYHGKPVTDEERKQVAEVILHISEHPDEYDVMQILWAAFAIKDYPLIHLEEVKNNGDTNIR